MGMPRTSICGVNMPLVEATKEQIDLVKKCYETKGERGAECAINGEKICKYGL